MPRTSATEPFLESELQSLCDRCHNEIKRKIEHAYRRSEIKADQLRMNSTEAIRLRRAKLGCDENGIPLDPSHPWRVSLQGKKR